MVHKMIGSEFRESTVMMVTHRLQHVVAPGGVFDLVVVLSDGEIAECGTPKALMDKPEGLFRSLVEANDPRGE
jgi:ABC-type multidrug transport system fused ATPase/permease subunit